MSKENNVKSAVKANNAAVATAQDEELEDDSYESPFWFWVWMGGLVLLFVAFGLINKFNTSDSSKEAKNSPRQEVRQADKSPIQDSVLAVKQQK